MPKLNQQGVIHFLLFLLLGLGLVAGVYLVSSGNPLKLFSKASVSPPVGPETSFSLVDSGCSAGILCLLYGQPAPEEEFSVRLYARSDIEPANLFTAKMTFPKDLVEVKEIKIDGAFFQNWIENYYDNNSGEISLAGGVPSPGYQTAVGGGSALMATVIFRAKAIGKGTVVFTDSSAIYSNLNNINILTVKRSYDFSVEVKPSPTPTPTPSTALPSRVFVTSTAYSGNLGGLAGADAKCQERADAADLGGRWKAWLSDTTTSASSRISHDNGPYKLIDGTIIANDWSDLTDGTLQNKIKQTEAGAYTEGWYVWTYTDSGGNNLSRTNSYNCHNWTTSGTVLDNDLGIAGNNGYMDSNWTNTIVTPPCTGQYQSGIPGIHLYCFEQNPYTLPTPTPAPPSGTKGDGNKDGKINLIDMSVIHTDWMKTENKPNFHEGIDMNSDGLINTFDFALHRSLLLQLGVIKNR